MTLPVTFRPYSRADREACLALFDANCPEFFAPNERADFVAFLDLLPERYEVGEAEGRTVAAFGLIADDGGDYHLNWIMLDPDAQGAGMGSLIMERVIALGASLEAPLIKIAASQKSARFFSRFGAIARLHTEDGWGPGMDRIDMELHL